MRSIDGEVVQSIGLSFDPLQMLHAVLKAVQEGIHIFGGVVCTEGHPDGRVDGQRAAAHGRQRVAGLAPPA